jgi:putative DNA-invertase from lambdoid prophage Rac
MNVAVYLRVSSDSQDTANQLPQLERLCKERGWNIIDIYSEDESAWKSGHQAELAKLLQVIKTHRRKYDIVLCWALDRMTRQGAAAILSLAHTLRLYGVQLISYQESWTEAPGGTGDLLFSIFGWIAQQESNRRSERTKAALAKKKADGIRLGRPPGSKDSKKRRKKRPVVFKFGIQSVDDMGNK